MTDPQTPFIDRLASHIGAEVATDLPEAGGYSQVSWDSTKTVDGPALVSTIAQAVLEKKPGVKTVFFKREYDIDADDYTMHRVLFW